jgi:hypothetical protein
MLGWLQCRVQAAAVVFLVTTQIDILLHKFSNFMIVWLLVYSVARVTRLRGGVVASGASVDISVAHTRHHSVLSAHGPSRSDTRRTRYSRPSHCQQPVRPPQPRLHPSAALQL